MALQKMIGLIVGKGVDPFRLLDYLGYTLGNTLPSTIPMACLMGGIMAAGRLSGDSEITAMRSAGISFTKIYFNFLIFGFIMAGVVAYFNFKVGPENTKKMNDFNAWIVAYNPLLVVTPGQFSGDTVKDNFESKGRTLYTDDVNKETGECIVERLTSSDLTTTQFCEYILEIQKWGSEFLGIDIPSPNEENLLNFD
jgi:lipopolysaccharide export system permease protein